MSTAHDGLPPLSEDDVYRLCGPTVYQRAQRYYRNGAVLRPRIEDAALLAEVQGSRRKPYQVSVTFAPDQIVSSCDCPYWAEHCKHVGALLLTWAHDPRRFTQSNERSLQAAEPPPQPAAQTALLEVSLPRDLAAGDASPAEDLRSLLDLRTVAELRGIARRRGLQLRGTAKTELGPQLVAGLLEPEGLRAAVAALESFELVTLDLVHVLARGQHVKAARVAAALAALEVNPPGGAALLLLDLRDRGLVANGARGGDEEDCYRVPAGVVPYLPPADHLVRRSAGGAPAAPSRLPPDELLYLLWRHFQQHAVQRREPVPRSLLEKTSELLRGWQNVPEEVAALQQRPNWQWSEAHPLTALPPPPEIADADREAVDFGFHLLRQLRLLTGKDRFVVHDEAVRRFLRLTPALRRRAIAVAWLQLTEWSELTLVLRHDGRLRLRRVLSAFGHLKPKDLFERLAEGRRLLVRLLLRLEEGVWYALPALAETARTVAGDRLADHSLWQGHRDAKWWLEWGAERQLDPRVPADWARGYGRFVEEALRGPLTWLGVVTVADAGGEPAFRLDGLRALLGAAPPPDDAVARPLRVDPDMTVTVPAGCGDLQVHDFLLAVAEQGEATPEGLRYRLTPASACAAFAAGHDAPTIAAFLERATAGRLPEGVRSTLEDWWQRYGSLHLYADLALVELADDYTLAELLAATGLSRHLIWQFSPRLIAVDPEGLDALVDELVRKGYTPKVAEEAGLAFSSGLSPDYGGATTLHLGTPGQLIFIPDEALAPLPPVGIPLPDPPAVADADAREPAPQTLQRDLYLYWRFAGRNELALTARGFVPKRQVAKLAETLVVGEEVDGAAGEQDLGRIYFLRRLLEDLGLLRHLQGRLLPAPEALAFLALPLAERVRRSYEAWLHSDRWNELLRLPGVAVDFGSNAHRVGTPSPILKARQFVVALLAVLPAERWIPLAHLWERAGLVDCDFLFPRDYRLPESSNGYYGRRSEPNPYERAGNALGWTFAKLEDDENGWRTVEGGFIAAVLREPLHWLGLVALGFEQDRPAAFRITELGARLLRGEALPAAAAPTGQVVVQPNFQIFAFDPVGEHVLATLDRFAELVRAEQAVEFRLTRESVYRAQQESMPVAAIVAFLEAAGGRPLPQNVGRTLAEWASHHERIVVRRNVSLIHSADPALLDTLLADDGLAPQLGGRLAPTAAVIARGAKGLGPLAAALHARGHLPAISHDGSAVTKGAIVVAPDGRIAFQQRLPGIYVWRRLAPLAEEREGALWLTPASVQRAIDGGLSAEQVIQQLADAYHGALPAAVADRIKVWAKHWGDAALAAITLLRVKDEAILAELMADPAIGPLLQPFVPQGAVAVVRPADLARLRDALEAKGIEVLDEK